MLMRLPRRPIASSAEEVSMTAVSVRNSVTAIFVNAFDRERGLVYIRNVCMTCVIAYNNCVIQVSIYCNDSWLSIIF